MKESRREFLKKAGGAVGMTAFVSQMGYFGMMEALAKNSASAPFTDYKALVLVFLAGGNDGNNTVIPNYYAFEEGGYQAYEYARKGLAIPQNSLQTIYVPRMGHNFGLHPSLGSGSIGSQGNSGIYPLWEAGKMAIVTNVGTLVKPTTKVEYLTATHPKPYQLFSHSDQIEQQQSALSTVTDFKGWGGRISAKMTSSNPSPPLPLLTSIAGSQLFITGGPTPLVLSDANTPLNTLLKLDHGDININSTYLSIKPAFNSLVTPNPTPSPAPAKFVDAANEITKNALDAQAAILSGTYTDPISFPSTGIGQQLRQVARLIRLNQSLNYSLGNRQIFFCQLGGFDTHAYQLTTHASLLLQFSEAVRAFYDAMVDSSISNDVTTFTMSDFNRTLSPNGSGGSGGSDHAWGNHQFVIGGAVSGGNFYGVNTPNGTPFPDLEIGGDFDADSGSGARGRLIPTTSVDEYAVALARWFGLSENDVDYVFPNYSANFKISTRCAQLNFLGTQPCT